MLGSLLKYDFKALNKIMLPLQLGVLAAGIIGTVCFSIFFRGVTSSSYGYSSYASSSAVSMAEGFAQMFAFLGAITLFSLVYLSGFITLLLIARHVYKNFYSSEGYLTFTLPVSVDKHLASKTISGVIWLLVNAIIIIAVTVLLLVFGFATDGLVSFDVIKGLGEVFQEFATPMGVLYSIELLIFGILYLIGSVLQIVFSVVLGGALARTHKVLAAIGVYILSGMATSFISSIFSFIGTLSTYNISISYVTDWFIESQPTIIISMIVSLGFAVGFYFLSRVSLKNSLNLD